MHYIGIKYRKKEKGNIVMSVWVCELFTGEIKKMGNLAKQFR